MFYTCKKVQHKPINIQVRDPIQRSKRNQVCCGLAHRTVFGVPCPYEDELATLGKMQARSAIIHWTVRCATELSDELANNGYLSATVDSAKVNNAAIVQRRRAESQRGTGLSGVAPDCPAPQEDKAPTVDRAPNPNGWVTWQHTG
jgi:hypothetical protein